MKVSGWILYGWPESERSDDRISDFETELTMVLDKRLKASVLRFPILACRA